MTAYAPDRFKIIEITDNGETYYKVFGTFFGRGIWDSESWRMNSGVESYKIDGDFIHFIGFSGSTYICHVDSYGSTHYTESILRGLFDHCKNNNTPIREVSLEEFLEKFNKEGNDAEIVH